MLDHDRRQPQLFQKAGLLRGVDTAAGERGFQHFLAVL
jgi:hypothetical protein